MGIDKRPLNAARVRRIGSAGFGWIDRRFIREHAPTLTRDEIVLYLFLVAVADHQGLSYWGDARVASLLKLRSGELVSARDGLSASRLIAYRAPLYQVLELPPAERAAERRRGQGGATSLGDILRSLAADDREE